MKFNDTVTRIENIIRNVVYIRRIGKLVFGLRENCNNVIYYRLEVMRVEPNSIGNDNLINSIKS